MSQGTLVQLANCVNAIGLSSEPKRGSEPKGQSDIQTKKKKSSGVSPRGHRITMSSEPWYLSLWWPDSISCIFSFLMGFLVVVTMWGWSLWCAVKQQCERDPIQKKVWPFHLNFCFVVTLQWHRDDLWVCWWNDSVSVLVSYFFRSLIFFLKLSSTKY